MLGAPVLSSKPTNIPPKEEEYPFLSKSLNPPPPPPLSKLAITWYNNSLVSGRLGTLLTAMLYWLTSVSWQ